MSKIWKIIKYEYRHHVLRRRFLIALLSVPLWLIAVMAISILAVVLTTNNTPIGYIDYSGFLAHPVESASDEIPLFRDVKIVAFPQEEQAQAALDAGKIQAYYVLEADYLQTRHARMVYKEEPSGQVEGTFRSFLRRNLLAGQPEDVAERVTSGPELTIRATQDNREMKNNEWFKVAAPMVAGILLVIVVFTSGGYLMQSVVEEKENRTMEILATSLSPMQIMGGKIIALMAVGLTQVLVWGIVPIAGVLLATAYIPSFRASMDWTLVGLLFLLMVPTFVMVSALMAAIGATVTEAREGQQVSSLITLPTMVPYMLMNVLIASPGSPVAIILSLFPLTAALTILIRLGFSTIPTWQIAVSIVILILSAVGSLWLAGRIFRLGMLRYGQRVRWKDIFSSLKPGSAK